MGSVNPLGQFRARDRAGNDHLARCDPARQGGLHQGAIRAVAGDGELKGNAVCVQGLEDRSQVLHPLLGPIQPPYPGDPQRLLVCLPGGGSWLDRAGSHLNPVGRIEHPFGLHTPESAGQFAAEPVRHHQAIEKVVLVAQIGEVVRLDCVQGHHDPASEVSSAPQSSDRGIEGRDVHPCHQMVGMAPQQLFQCVDAPGLAAGGVAEGDRRQAGVALGVGAPPMDAVIGDGYRHLHALLALAGY